MSVIVYNFSWPSKGQRSCASTAEQRSAVLSLPLSRFGAVQMDGQTDRRAAAGTKHLLGADPAPGTASSAL